MIGESSSPSNVGLLKPNSKQTIISKCLVNQPNNTTIHTVTTGKTFFCTYIRIFNVGAGTLTSRINDGSNDLAFNIFSQSISIEYNNGIIFSSTTGTVIKLLTNVGNSTITMCGWEE